MLEIYLKCIASKNKKEINEKGDFYWTKCSKKEYERGIKNGSSLFTKETIIF
jgi:hypothetical protein